MDYYSPLRYPGGKNKLAAFVAKLCEVNNISGIYFEPYSGGSSVALSLLMEGIVQNIVINDKDRSIYAFWYSVLQHNSEFVQLIKDTKINVDTWQVQRHIQENKAHADLLSLGFSTFFMNRCNRSGIINGGIIGGRNQDGPYLMDCRFNKNDLIDRIIKIGRLRDRISLYQLDALDLLSTFSEELTLPQNLIYFDPPYFNKASTLYMNHYTLIDHQNLSSSIKEMKLTNWLVSYDNVLDIRNLYSEYVSQELNFKHTAYAARVGKEVIFYSPNLKISQFIELDPVKFRLRGYYPARHIIYQGKKQKNPTK